MAGKPVWRAAYDAHPSALRSARFDRELTQSALAKKAGVSTSTIGKCEWRRHKVGPRYSTALAITAALLPPGNYLVVNGDWFPVTT